MHHDHADPSSLDLGRTVRDLGPAATRWPVIAGAAGLIAAVLLALLRALVVGEGSLERFLFGYLHNFMYFLTIAIGALFFVIVHHLVRAGWSVTVRRIAEVLAANIWPTFALLFLPILIAAWIGGGLVFPWTSPEYVAGNPVVHHKIGYFNLPWDRSGTIPLFFTLRAFLYFALWAWLARSFYTASLRQDDTGEPMISKRLEGRAAWAVLVVFLTFTFASIDWVMSLNPTWFSTMFGVYVIAGSALSFFAALWVLVYFAQSRGVLEGAVTVEHQHDIGKYIFGFIVFWSYITFCQFLLIWYADIPEETQWYLVRQNGGWQWIGLLLIVGHFVIPFFGIMSRHVKRNRKALLFWAVWMLVVHWFDLAYMILPEAQSTLLPAALLSEHDVQTASAQGTAVTAAGFLINLLMDLSLLVGVGGLTLAGFVRTAAGHPLVPVKDPRLAESLAFHNV